MIAKKKKSKKSQQSPFFPILFIFLISAFISLLVFYNFKINQRRTKLLSEIRELEKEIQNLEEKNAQLKAGISQVGKESYWEERVREQGFVREGENQVVVLPPESNLEKEQEFQKEGIWKEISEKLKAFFARVIQW